jgi:hypothetical protein
VLLGHELLHMAPGLQQLVQPGHGWGSDAASVLMLPLLRPALWIPKQVARAPTLHAVVAVTNTVLVQEPIVETVAISHLHRLPPLIDPEGGPIGVRSVVQHLVH